jgi:signal transduction histidine kinase
MKRPAVIWLVFFLFLAAGVAAMGWMTRRVLRLEAESVRAAAAAGVEENVRLALWRMDYAMSPLISAETARPYFEYSSVFPAERAYNRMFTELKGGDVLVPSPLLRVSSPVVLLHFQVDPDGRVSSPQTPDERVRRIAVGRYATAEEMDAAARRLAEFQRVIDVSREELAKALPAPRDAEAWAGNRLRVGNNGTIASANSGGGFNPNYNYSVSNANGEQSQENQQQQQQQLQQQQRIVPNQSPEAYNRFDVGQQATVQQARGQQEYQARSRTQMDNNDLLNSAKANYISPGVATAVMQPLWLGDRLVLARRVSIGGREYVQGCWLDWSGVRRWLLDSASDLVSGGADVVPVRKPSEEKQPRMLATIPARLVVSGEPGAVAAPSFWAALKQRSPTHVTLTIAWAGVLLGAAAVAMLLRGVMALSARRGEFVSAVTHELRTPLTTLRMYTEMLADGMVADEEAKASYIKTLRAESGRLGHLVDNVLLYSRLERSQRDARIEVAGLAELLDRLVPRLTDRVSQAGMHLEVAVSEGAKSARIRANLLSVEQILFNLVDNSCKYASAAADKRVDLSVARVGEAVEIRVADHGPGLSAGARAKLFRPFSKSVQEAAASAPGLGLGLALSRRLAGNMGGALRWEGSGDGAVFVLVVPSDET